MPANLKNSAVATGMEKVSFHCKLKERQFQRTFKLLYNCTHFTWQQDYAQNPSSQALAVHESRTSSCTSWIQKKRNQRSNCQHLLDYRKSRGIRDQIANICWIIEKAVYFCFIEYAKAFDCVDHNKVWKILKERGIKMTLPVSWETCMQDKK